MVRVCSANEEGKNAQAGQLASLGDPTLLLILCRSWCRNPPIHIYLRRYWLYASTWAGLHVSPGRQTCEGTWDRPSDSQTPVVRTFLAGVAYLMTLFRNVHDVHHVHHVIAASRACVIEATGWTHQIRIS